MDSLQDKNKKVNIDINTVRVIYQHYKAYLLPFFMIIISVLLLLFFVVPEINHYLISLEQEKKELEKLSNLQNTLTILSNLDESKLDRDLTSLSYALPVNKDFAGILNAISSAAIKTGISLGNFEFVVGDLAKTTDASVYPSIEVAIKTDGDVASTVNYLSEIYRSSPVAEIGSVKLSDGASVLKILFFHKPYRSVVINEDKRLGIVSARDEELISTVSSWSNQGNSLASVFLSTPSGEFSEEGAAASGQTNDSPF